MSETSVVRLSEILSALSTVLDIVEGQPEGHAIRSCFIGMTIAERLSLTEEQRSALFYALLLKDTGCSSNASRVTALFGADDFDAKRNMKTVNWSNLLHAGWFVARNVSPGGTAWSKARHFVGLGRQGTGAARELVQIRCDRGAEIARFLGFPEETAAAIHSLDEHWDGAGYPDGLRGEQIPLLARIGNLAQTVEVFSHTFGPSEAQAMVRARRKRWFDPALVDIFLDETRRGHLWERLMDAEMGAALDQMEPPDREMLATPERLDRVAHAFARIIDAKSPFTFQHSERVAAAVTAMTEFLGFPAVAVRDLMRAGLLHDIGKLAISNRILDKPGALTEAERRAIEKHPEMTRHVLSRVSPFRPIADVAAAHHERLDGSGYCRGLSGPDLSLPMRALAVADVYDALSSARPYRAAMPTEQVLAILRRERGSALCPESVDAVIALVSQGALAVPLAA